MEIQQEAWLNHPEMKIVLAIVGAIESAGESGLPNGPLYAIVSDKLTLDQYTRIISILEQAGLIKQENNVLKWAGLKKSIQPVVYENP